jgi:hypothetical protein
MRKGAPFQGAIGDGKTATSAAPSQLADAARESTVSAKLLSRQQQMSVRETIENPLFPPPYSNWTIFEPLD